MRKFNIKIAVTSNKKLYFVKRNQTSSLTATMEFTNQCAAVKKKKVLSRSTGITLQQSKLKQNITKKLRKALKIKKAKCSDQSVLNRDN